MLRLVLSISLSLACTGLLHAQAAASDRFFKTTDGVRLHYSQTGPVGAPTIVFVPGWTMPAWIFQQQIDFFARSWNVVAFDPRGQGDSEAPASGYEPIRRGQDIAELLGALGDRQVVLVGWSLGVLDSLAYVNEAGDGHLLALVLIDNSVGEAPAPAPPLTGGRRPLRRQHGAQSREAAMARFVRGMFRRPQDPAWLARLTDAALQTPAEAAKALLAYPVPRSFWRDAIYRVHKPILYVVRPGLQGQADNLQANHPDVQSTIYADAGHALFVDDADRFNSEMRGFLLTHIRR